MTTQVFDNYFPPDYFYGLKNKVMEENFKWTFGTKLNDNQFFFDYLKKEIKEKRKMGHITILI